MDGLFPVQTELEVVGNTFQTKDAQNFNKKKNSLYTPQDVPPTRPTTLSRIFSLR